ncbi:MAG: iron-sulfur cluster assembly scaffold protein [Candidatus Zixiibacteriota bacterium]
MPSDGSANKLYRVGQVKDSPGIAGRTHRFAPTQRGVELRIMGRMMTLPDRENFGYNATVTDHFQNPRNAGDMEDPSCVGIARNSECGDLLKLYLKIDGGRIVAAKFKTYGCGAAIASSSMLTELLIGRTVAEATAITNVEVAEALGGLPERKLHCSVLAQEATRAAMADWGS